MKFSIKGLTGAATLLAAALGLNLLGPHRAYSAPGSLTQPGESELGVTILSPDPRVPLEGLKPVEISAFYQGSPGNQIVAVELYLDGIKAASKSLDVPETRGVVSFLVDAGQLSAGTHKIVVRATSADQEVKSARSAFVFGLGSGGSQPLISEQSSGAPALGLPTRPAISSGEAPSLRMINPSDDGKIRGVVTLHLEATDASGKSPYVSLFIDKTFKTLRNYAPYEFEWDTTAYPNGYHTIEAYGYNDSPNVGHSKTIRLYVNNEGGNTSIRHDLLDGAAKPVAKPAAVKAVKSVAAAAPRKVLGRPAPQRRPVLMATVQPAPRAEASTHAILRQMAKAEATALHFGPLNFASPNAAVQLSSPFVAETPPKKPLQAPKQNFKPMPTAATAAIKPMPTATIKPMPTATVKAITVDPNTATLAAVPVKHLTAKRMRITQMATLRLPSSELASPFLVTPHVAPAAAMARIQIGTYFAEMHLARATIKPVMKMHPLRVHFPSSMGSLLRSVGQTSVLFNHTTVKLDRPLSVQNSILFGPLRQIFESGGGTLTWQARTGTVHAKSATKDILITIGKSQAQINSRTVDMDGKPYLLTGRTMVPLSFVTAAMDADVQYDAATGHLMITSRK